MASILFLCVYNACRSQMAEGICRSLVPETWNVASAGVRPSRLVDPKALMILEQNGLPFIPEQPKGQKDLPDIDWDYLVRMDGEKRGLSVRAKKIIEWTVPDPQDGPMSLYRALFKDLTQRIQSLVQEIREAPP